MLLEYLKQKVDEQMSTFQLDTEAVRVWNEYTVPENVRELRNIVIRLSAKYPGQPIKACVLKIEMSGLHRQNSSINSEGWLKNELHADHFQLDQTLKSVEKELIDLALSENDGNVSKAADMLGINRTTLYGRMGRQDGEE